MTPLAIILSHRIRAQAGLTGSPIVLEPKLYAAYCGCRGGPLGERFFDSLCERTRPTVR